MEFLEGKEILIKERSAIEICDSQKEDWISQNSVITNLLLNQTL